MPEQTEVEIRQQYIAAMGAELGELFFRYWHECVWLHLKWEEFVVLFGTSPERIELLNCAAKSFFRTVQDALWNDVLLHICRLIDPPQSMGKDNLTLRRLPAIVEPALQAQVVSLLDTCLAKCEFATDWRKRYLAHRDLHLSLQRSAKPLAPASRKQVSEAIASMGSLLNAVQLHYQQSETWWAGPIAPLGNAEALLYVLREGVQAESRRRERIRSGQFTPEDLKRQPAL
jgi:AbiU2